MHKRAWTTPWGREDIVRLFLADKQTLRKWVVIVWRAAKGCVIDHPDLGAVRSALPGKREEVLAVAGAGSAYAEISD